MKDILEIAFGGECKNAVLTDAAGKHFFCAEPTEFGKVYCDTCGRRMNNPTRHFVDSAERADAFAGGKTRRVTPREEPAGDLVPVTTFIDREVA